MIAPSSASSPAETVYHSNSVLSNLSATLTSKPPLAIRYRLDDGALEDPPGGGDAGKASHCSTLERLLTWEKKLYKEVRVRLLRHYSQFTLYFLGPPPLSQGGAPLPETEVSGKKRPAMDHRMEIELAPMEDLVDSDVMIDGGTRTANNHFSSVKENMIHAIISVPVRAHLV